ncbi:hypothetical protein [Rossellomorea marisflavi]|uniref:hypothetical protein n=1 Tax=Rossellomorea marisflavi TaxID=189381 RepID=UPI00190F5507|nr:hypothetical protein [Rossellomorea marisflavi]
MVDWWRGFGDWGGLLWSRLAGFVEDWWIIAFLCLAPCCLFVPGTLLPFCAWHLFAFLCLAPFCLFVPGSLKMYLNALLDIPFINLPPGFYK